MNIHVESASHIITPAGMPVSFYIIIYFSQSTLWSIQSQYHPQYKLTECQIPNLSPGGVISRPQMNKPRTTLS